MDLIEQAAGVWARKWIVLVVALAAAAAVFVWRSAAPEEYSASTTVQVRLPEAGATDPAVQVPYYATSVAGLADSREIVARALAQAGRSGDDVDDASDHVSTSIDSTTGFVTITAGGSTGGEAAALADAMASVLGAEIATDQADDLAAQRAAVTDSIASLAERRRQIGSGDVYAIAALERERESLLGTLRSLTDVASWRLAVVEPAQAPDSADSPQPLRDALLAFIIALLLAGEAVVVARALRGSLSARDPGRDAGDVAGVPAVLVRGEDGPTSLAPLLPQVETGRAVTVIQRGRAAGAHGASMLARLLAARGENVVLVDAAPHNPTVHATVGLSVSPGLTELGAGDRVFDELPERSAVRVLVAGRPTQGSTSSQITRVIKDAPQDRVVIAAASRLVDDLLPISAALDGPTVLEVDASTTRRQLRTDVASLRGLGLDVVGVVVNQAARSARSSRSSRSAVKGL